MAASVIARCNGYSDVVGTVNGNSFTINFPPSENENGSTWNIEYTDDRGCVGTTTYHVEPAPCSYSISCNPTSKQLQSGQATTVVKVTTSRDGCDTRFTVNNETTQYNGSGNGYTYTATSAGTYTFKCVGDTSKTCTFTVSEEPAVCDYTCADVLGVTANTRIPANPTGNVFIFSYEFDNRNHTSGGKHNGLAFYYDGTNHMFTGNSDNSWVFEGSSSGGIYHCDVYLPSRFIQQNTGSTTRSEILHVKAYICSDNTYGGYTGYTNMPTDVACPPSALTLTQLAAAQTCNITSITLDRDSYELPYGKCSNVPTEAGELAKNMVHIGYENCQTPPTWEAYVGSTFITSGNNDTYFKPPYSSTFTIRCREKTSLTKTYNVTCGNPPFTIQTKSGTPPGNGMIELTYTGTSISSWTGTAAANWQTLESPRKISLEGNFVCAEITGLTLDLSLNGLTISSRDNVSVEGVAQSGSGPNYNYGNTYLTIQTNGGCVINKSNDPDCDKNDYYASYTLHLSNDATIDVEIHLKPKRY